MSQRGKKFSIKLAGFPYPRAAVHTTTTGRGVDCHKDSCSSYFVNHAPAQTHCALSISPQSTPIVCLLCLHVRARVKPAHCARVKPAHFREPHITHLRRNHAHQLLYYARWTSFPRAMSVPKHYPQSLSEEDIWPALLSTYDQAQQSGAATKTETSVSLQLQRRHCGFQRAL